MYELKGQWDQKLSWGSVVPAVRHLDHVDQKKAAPEQEVQPAFLRV